MLSVETTSVVVQLWFSVKTSPTVALLPLKNDTTADVAKTAVNTQTSKVNNNFFLFTIFYLLFSIYNKIMDSLQHLSIYKQSSIRLFKVQLN